MVLSRETLFNWSEKSFKIRVFALAGAVFIQNGVVW
jgi:hypothetical protein